MREKLTDRLAKTLGPGIYWDTHANAPKGFLLQVTSGGARTYRLNYSRQADGVERRTTIGSVQEYSKIAEARDKAADLRRAIRDGRDPLGEIEDRRAEPTVEELVQRYTNEILPRRAPRTQVEYRAMLDGYVRPAIGSKKISAVTQTDIERMHRRITDDGKLRRANSVRMVCSILFNQAIAWKLRSDNPCRFVKGNAEHGRERYLSPDEVQRLIDTLERWHEKRPESCNILWLLLLTGARRGEVLGMRWDQLDLDAGTWSKPASLTKQKRSHRVPLSPQAVDILRRRQAEQLRPGQVVRLRRDDYVFRGGGDGASINRVERDWAVIRAAAGLEDVRLHDLRHSFASVLVSSGLSLPIIGALLGHSKSATTARYAHLADQPLREAAAIAGAAFTNAKVKK
jgi:integrase